MCLHVSKKEVNEKDTSMLKTIASGPDIKKMASSPTRHHLTCDVCLQLFKKPITLGCGHSFCRECVDKFWESRRGPTACICPSCREVFPQRPQLKKNVILANLVSQMKWVETMEEPKCTEHEELIQLYCMDDGSLMCLMCMSGEHRSHTVVPVEIAHAELKVTERHSGKLSKEILEKKRKALYRAVDEVVDLMKKRLNERQEEKLSCLEQQKQKLQQEIAALQEAGSMLQKALQELEVIAFLKVGCFASNILYSRHHIIHCILEGRLIIYIVYFWLRHQPIVSADGQNLSLDPNSAHPLILISPDFRKAMRSVTKQPYPAHLDRFQMQVQVMANEEFFSGRHYWEVDMTSAQHSRVGVACSDIPRKLSGHRSRLGDNKMSWCIMKCKEEYTMWHSRHKVKILQKNIQWVGLYLDYDAGILSFYGDSHHLYTYQTSFSSPLKPTLGLYYFDDSLQFCEF
uniref:Uncharacterized protein n=1 Tax=Eptatretus burgeri TaxID=7764 RepID=A0A8C4WW38_EPTBU